MSLIQHHRSSPAGAAAPIWSGRLLFWLVLCWLAVVLTVCGVPQSATPATPTANISPTIPAEPTAAAATPALTSAPAIASEPTATPAATPSTDGLIPAALVARGLYSGLQTD